MSFLVDTHCHIHDANFDFDLDEVFSGLKEHDVRQIICIGTSGADSEKAVEFASTRQGVWASVGLHPHDAKLGEDDLEIIARLAVDPKVVAIGEFGLDYYYDNSPRSAQIQALEYQLQIAMSYQKPCVFHIRDAFDDFWPVFDNFRGLKGVIHSFTAGEEEVERALERGLYMGLNGILTFTKDDSQIESAKKIPLSHIVLETDSPFLTPPPLRGTINVPANVRLVAACLAEMRGDTLGQLIEATTKNAQKLFSLPSNDIIS